MRVIVFWCGTGALLGLACGGTTHETTHSEPPPPHVALAAGAFHTCGLRVDGTLTCWGDEPSAGTESAAPAGTYTAVAVARRYACALDTAQSVHCFWLDTETRQLPAPTGKFVEIAAAYWSTCGLRTDGHEVCWTDSDAPSDTNPDVTFSHIAVGNGGCGITTKGVTSC